MFVNTGAVVDPPTGPLLGEYAAGRGYPYGPVGFVVDSAAHRVYFFEPGAVCRFPHLPGTPSQLEYENDTQNSAAFTLQIYNLKTRSLLDSIVIPNVTGYPNQMISLGKLWNCLTTENGDYLGNNAPGLTYILSAPEISGPISAQQESLEGEAPVRLTWQPRKRGEHAGKGK